MIRCLAAFVLALTTALSVSSSIAGEVEDVLRLWATQRGQWTGSIDIYAGSDPNPTTVDLVTHWDTTPDQAVITKIETFISETSQNSSVTLMFAAPDSNKIVTPYFTGSKQRDYYFAVVSSDVTDDLNWTTVIASPDGQEVYENRPAVLRYVRTRTGMSIVNTKEVNFLDDNGDDTFELRSLINQTMTPPDQPE